MKLAVIGTGHVGLVTAACFAESGNDVVCVGREEAALRLLRRGAIPLFEPGLEDLVRRNRAEKRLVFSSQVAPAVRNSTIVFIAAGTPTADDDGSGDIGRVLDVGRDVARAMNGYKVVADRTAAGIGTAGRVREVIRRETTHPFSVVSNPGFLEPGTAVERFMRPDRVVIGAEDPRAAQLMTELYAPFTRAGAPVMVMDCASADVCQFAAQAMFAARMSFVNEVARVCQLFGADADQVRRGIASDRRVGPALPFPGVGYGGSGAAMDAAKALRLAADAGYCFQILDAAERVNRRQPDVVVEALQAHFGTLDGKIVALWGLAAEAGSDDLRGAPSLAIVERLLAAGAAVTAYDPRAGKAARALLGTRVKLASRGYDALVGADALVVVTEWSEFREPDFSKVRKLMRSPVVFDGRNIYNRERMRADGFTYFAVGR
jgi:UDPglucose 6-dehydrogenase